MGADAMPSEDDLFAAMEEALVIEGVARGGCCGGEAACTPIYLANGDVHLCAGRYCLDVELNSDKHYVCRYTGIVTGRLAVREDFSTGRNAGSSNPDDHCGEPVGGTWRPKKDQVALSHLAYQHADSLGAKADEDNMYVAADGPKKAPGGASKRGARCVDDQSTPELPPEAKRQRQRQGARRVADSREEFAALCEEAQTTMNKLVNFEKRIEAKKVAAAVPRVDAGALFDAAVRKYRKECAGNNETPTLDALHNIALRASQIAAEQHKKQAVVEGYSALLLRARTRQSVATLAVLLWLASCATPYMKDSSKRGADSFRPFVAGVLYALKRGVSLKDGTVVLPHCDELADALPALRATAANSAAKAIHASSHRGLCTLHRSIASCDDDEAARLYADAARKAEVLAEDVRCKRFDI